MFSKFQEIQRNWTIGPEEWLSNTDNAKTAIHIVKANLVNIKCKHDQEMD